MSPRTLHPARRLARFARRMFLTLAALTLLATAPAQDTPSQAQILYFENVTVFDGEALLPATNVLVADGVIVEVGPEVAAPDGATVIDGSGRTLLPGLIDAHVHTFAPEMLQQALMFGVTTVLDMFSDEGFAAAMRQEQHVGAADYRADMLSSGTLATAPGGHGSQFGLEIETLTSPDEAAAWVERRVEAGADYIKIVIEEFAESGGEPLPTLDEATVAALNEAAHAHGLLTATHVQNVAAAEMAIRSGGDGLAHMFLDALPSQELIDLMLERQAFVIATLPVFQSIGSEDPVDESLAHDPNIAPLLTPADLQSLQSPYSGFEGLSLATALEGVGLLHASGVPILAGSDAPNPGTAYGASLHRELELPTQAGLTPTEALAAATSVTARVFGLEDRGRIAPGLVADLVLVEGNPVDDILASRAIVGVWKRGVQADREAYAQALEGTRQAGQAQADMLAEGEVALISDFEADDLSVSFGQPWAPTTDEQAGGDSQAEIAVVEGGAGGSAGALEIRGVVGSAFELPWAGAMFMPGAQPFGPADLSPKPNLHFWARGGNVDGGGDGGGTYRIQLFCQNTGQVPAEVSFEVSDEWQEHSFDLAEIGGCDVSGVMAIIFSAGTPGEFAFQLDQVELR